MEIEQIQYQEQNQNQNIITELCQPVLLSSQIPTNTISGSGSPAPGPLPISSNANTATPTPTQPQVQNSFPQNPNVNIFFSRYYEIDQFEDKMIIQDYICPLCGGVYNNPVVDGCGHVFCSDCITLSMKKSVFCPISYRDLSKDSFHQIPFINSIISKHVINCKNRCGWKKNLSFYKSHLEEECPNILLTCKFDCCNECYLRSEKEAHEANCDFRLINCEFCKDSIPFVKLNDHYDICPKVKIYCDQACDMEIERCERDEHILNICPRTLVSCALEAFGCCGGYPRFEEEKHNKEFKYKHIEMIGKNCLIIKELCLKIETQGKELKSINEKFEKYKEEINFTNKEMIQNVHNIQNMQNQIQAQIQKEFDM
jgi:hypothetical protein